MHKAATMQPIDSLQDLMHDCLARNVVHLPPVLEQELAQGVIRAFKHDAAIPVNRLRQSRNGTVVGTILSVGILFGCIVILRLWLRRRWFDHVFHLNDVLRLRQGAILELNGTLFMVQEELEGHSSPLFCPKTPSVCALRGCRASVVSQDPHFCDCSCTAASWLRGRSLEGWVTYIYRHRSSLHPLPPCPTCQSTRAGAVAHH
mmetsp:Transcript_40440/g.67759  ORF Transcript_40440/g.67759 Transcript_40440/m.67759 type:complete len:203 (-) Transcript_40440:217-825(-)